MNTIKDLKREVLSRMQHLDGMYFESVSTVSVEEMLGIIDFDETYTPEKTDNTLLDPEHPFWDDYMRDLLSEKSVREEVETAIRLLRDEERVRVVDPYDDELSGVSVEVDGTEEPSIGGDFYMRVKEQGSRLTLIIETENGEYERTFQRR